MDQFFTWEMLATYAGATAVTALVTQLFKNVGWIKKVPTRVLSYVIAAVILLVATYFVSGFVLDKAALCFVNAVVVAFASNGAFDAMTNKSKEAKEE